MNLTPKQLQCLTFIKHHMATRGVSPTISEIKTALGVKSKGSTFLMVRRLMERGAIRMTAKRARSIEIVEPKSYRSLLGAGLATSVECRALAEGIEPETYIKECVRERVEMS